MVDSMADSMGYKMVAPLESWKVVLMAEMTAEMKE